MCQYLFKPFLLYLADNSRLPPITASAQNRLPAINKSSQPGGHQALISGLG